MERELVNALDEHEFPGVGRERERERESREREQRESFFVPVGLY